MVRLDNVLVDDDEVVEFIIKDDWLLLFDIDGDNLKGEEVCCGEEEEVPRRGMIRRMFVRALIFRYQFAFSIIATWYTQTSTKPPTGWNEQRPPLVSIALFDVLALLL